MSMDVGPGMSYVFDEEFHRRIREKVEGARVKREKAARAAELEGHDLWWLRVNGNWVGRCKHCSYGVVIGTNPLPPEITSDIRKEELT